MPNNELRINIGLIIYSLVFDIYRKDGVCSNEMITKTVDQIIEAIKDNDAP